MDASRATHGRVSDQAGRPAAARRPARRRPQGRSAAARRDHDVTFEAAARQWLRYVEFDRGRRASTMRDYRRTVEQVFLPLFGELPLRAVTSELIDNYRGHLVAEGHLSARSINKYLLVLHAIFKRAQRHYGLPVNPVAGVDRQPVRRAAEFRVLPAEEVAALARAAREGRHRTSPNGRGGLGVDPAHLARE